MCVIIYVPKDATIEKSEVLDAWRTNPDGAGFSVQRDGRVYFQRGFMNVEEFWNAIERYIGKTNLMLHFRISTSNAVNKVQTHPYKKGNVTVTRGFTDRPVICMNGIISGQKEYKGCNDTMSYICDHTEAFANINQDIINIIQEATGAKWAVMTPDDVFLSSDFQEMNGRWYSNKNHLWVTYVYSYNKNRKKQSKKHFNNMIKGKKLRKALKRDKVLYYDLLDFIDLWCNEGDNCQFCTKCLKNANTLRDVKIILDENYYWTDDESNKYCCDIVGDYNYYNEYNDNDIENYLNDYESLW